MKWRENIAVKALAFTAAVAAFTATAMMAWYQLANFDALWGESYDGAPGYTRRYLVAQDRHQVAYLADLKEMDAAGRELNLSARRELEQLEAEYGAGATNLRWQLLDEDGGIIYGNTREDSAAVSADYMSSYTRSAWRDGYTSHSDWTYWEDGAEYANAVNRQDYSGCVYDDRWRDQLAQLAELALEDGGGERLNILDGSGDPIISLDLDTVLCDEDTYTNVLLVSSLENDLYVYPPTVRACLGPNRFGFVFDPDGLKWTLDSTVKLEEKPQSPAEQATLVLWVDDALRVDDQYSRAAAQLARWHSSRLGYLAGTVLLGMTGLLLLTYLCCGAGHKRGIEGIYLNWFHRVPGDVLLFAMLLGGTAAVGIGIEHVLWQSIPMYLQLIYIGLAVACTAALGMGALITVCARCKARTLARNTLTWMFCAWCWRRLCQLMETMGRVSRALPLVWKAVAACMAYILFTILAFNDNGTLWLIVTALASLYLCLWACQWKKIRYGTQEIIGGNPNYHIDTRYMLPDLRGHADELNNLGHAISAAVEDRIKSERFRAELITNVSHDLKTPLTSIINYVDLLKKAEIADPKAAEYIEVLDRKSQRLKKLTEDLVEASKASTGSLTVNWERLDWAQLTDQALAECGDRLEAQGLTVVRTLPEGPVWVDADGRHLWRVLDNLLTNCAKYALPGTRVYVELREYGGRAVLSVKNISRDALDIPAERLMERFVRGDESRNAPGSGLGLSIAQSLTELQRGEFDISIDGDLFKAVVSLPLTGEDGGGMPILRL